jgi:hypothetical protein
VWKYRWIWATNKPVFDVDANDAEPDIYEIIAEIETLFPEFLSSNVKTYKNVEFDKIPGRNEHGCNLERRKVPKIGT